MCMQICMSQLQLIQYVEDRKINYYLGQLYCHQLIKSCLFSTIFLSCCIKELTFLSFFLCSLYWMNLIPIVQRTARLPSCIRRTSGNMKSAFLQQQNKAGVTVDSGKSKLTIRKMYIDAFINFLFLIHYIYFIKTKQLLCCFCLPLPIFSSPFCPPQMEHQRYHLKSNVLYTWVTCKHYYCICPFVVSHLQPPASYEVTVRFIVRF